MPTATSRACSLFAALALAAPAARAQLRPAPAPAPPAASRSPLDDEDMTLEDDRTMENPASVSDTLSRPRPYLPPPRKVRTAARTPTERPAPPEVPVKRGIRPWMMVVAVLLVLVGVELVLWWATSQD